MLYFFVLLHQPKVMLLVKTPKIWLCSFKPGALDRSGVLSLSFLFTRKKWLKGNRGSSDPSYNGRHYPNTSGGGHGAPRNVPGDCLPMMILMQVAQIIPFLSLEDDVDMINVLNSMSNLNRV